MSYAILRVQKIKSFSGIGRHIDRIDADGEIYVPDNADAERVSKNLHWSNDGKAFTQDEWRENVGKNSLAKRVNERIKDGYKLEKAIRKDAVKALEYLLTSDHKKMSELERDPEQFKRWLTVNRNFIENIHGKENIVSFSLHRDEDTPHLHVVIVPLTKEGRLTMEPFVGSPKLLAQLQDKYARTMEQFGMRRGKEGSGRFHERPDKGKQFEHTKFIER